MTPITIEVEVVKAYADQVDELLRHIAEQEERFYITAPGLGAPGEVEVLAARRANRWRLLKGLVERKLRTRRESLESARAFLRRRLDGAGRFGMAGYDGQRADGELQVHSQEREEALD